jgi:hypothetical protein
MGESIRMQAERAKDIRKGFFQSIANTQFMYMCVCEGDE